MRAALPYPPPDHLHIRPWPDPVIDRLGHDPRSTYVERFWLGVLGPSTTWLLRRVAAELDREPAGFDLALGDTARSLGLGGEGRNSPFVRALARCCQFDLATPEGEDVLAVRRKLPPLTRRQVTRLPQAVQEEHRLWLDGELRTPEAERLRRRSRQLALSLLELGEGLEAAERQLQRWRFHPAVAHESALWAWERHRRARAAAEAAGPEAGEVTGRPEAAAGEAGGPA
ncbi:MAG: hypothetical protein ACRDZ9_08905, partial [Acidimicrobiales bacterium]